MSADFFALKLRNVLNCGVWCDWEMWVQMNSFVHYMFGLEFASRVLLDFISSLPNFGLICTRIA